MDFIPIMVFFYTKELSLSFLSINKHYLPSKHQLNIFYFVHIRIGGDHYEAKSC